MIESDKLDAVTQAYADAALWRTETDNNDVSLDSLFDVDDIDSDSMRDMRADVRDFLESNETDARLAAERLPNGWESVGYDLWLTRNGHGAGFWDRGLGELGDRLTEACRPMGEAYLYVGDDGRVYYRG